MKYAKVEIKIDPRLLEVIEDHYGSLQNYLNKLIKNYAHCIDIKIKLPVPPKNKINPEQIVKAKAILKKHLKMIGGGFHPDNHFGDYVGRDHKPSFTDKQVLKYDKERRFVWKVLGEDQIYKTIKEIEKGKK